MDEKAICEELSDLKVVYVDSKITIATACPGDLQLDVLRQEDSFTESEITVTNGDDDAIASTTPSDPFLEELSMTVDEYIEDMQNDEENQLLINTHGCTDIAQINQDAVISRVSKSESSVYGSHRFLEGCLCQKKRSILQKPPKDEFFQDDVHTSQIAAVNSGRTKPVICQSSNPYRLLREWLDATHVCNPQLKQQKIFKSVDRTSVASQKRYRHHHKKSPDSSRAFQCIVQVGVKRPMALKPESGMNVNRSGMRAIRDPSFRRASKRSTRRDDRKEGHQHFVTGVVNRPRKSVLVLAMSTESLFSITRGSEDGSVTGSQTKVLPQWNRGNVCHGTMANRPFLDTVTMTELDKEKCSLRKSKSFHGPFHLASIDSCREVCDKLQDSNAPLREQHTRDTALVSESTLLPSMARTPSCALKGIQSESCIKDDVDNCLLVKLNRDKKGRVEVQKAFGPIHYGSKNIDMCRDSTKSGNIQTKVTRSSHKSTNLATRTKKLAPKKRPMAAQQTAGRKVGLGMQSTSRGLPSKKDLNLVAQATANSQKPSGSAIDLLDDAVSHENSIAVNGEKCLDRLSMLDQERCGPKQGSSFGVVADNSLQELHGSAPTAQFTRGSSNSCKDSCICVENDRELLESRTEVVAFKSGSWKRIRQLSSRSRSMETIVSQEYFQPSTAPTCPENGQQTNIREGASMLVENDKLGGTGMNDAQETVVSNISSHRIDICAETSYKVSRESKSLNYMQGTEKEDQAAAVDGRKLLDIEVDDDSGVMVNGDEIERSSGSPEHSSSAGQETTKQFSVLSKTVFVDAASSKDASIAVKVGTTSNSPEPTWFDVPKESQEAVGETVTSALAVAEQKDFVDCISFSTGDQGQQSEDEAVTATLWTSELDDDCAIKDPQSELEDQEDLVLDFSMYSVGTGAAVSSISLTGSHHGPQLRGEVEQHVLAPLKTNISVPSSIQAAPGSYGAFEAALAQILPSSTRHAVEVLRPKWDATADLFLQCENEVFSTHRLIVVHFSERLCDLLYKGALHPGRTLIIEGVPAAALKEVIDWMYTGKIDFQRVNILEVLLVALGLDIPALQELCSRVMTDSVQHSYSQSRHPEFCADAQAANFSSIVQEDCYLEYAVDKVCRLLSYDTVGAESEYHVYKAAVNWLAFKWPLRRRYVTQVLGRVRFPTMTTKMLHQLMTHDTADIAEHEILSIQEIKTILQDALYCKCYSLESQLTASHHKTVHPRRRFLQPEYVRVIFASKVPLVINMTTTATAAESKAVTGLTENPVRHHAEQGMYDDQCNVPRQEVHEITTVASHSSSRQQSLPPEVVCHKRVVKTKAHESLLVQQTSEDVQAQIGPGLEDDWVGLMQAAPIQPRRHAIKMSMEDSIEPIAEILESGHSALQTTPRNLSLSLPPENLEEESTGMVKIESSENIADVSGRNHILLAFQSSDMDANTAMINTQKTEIMSGLGAGVNRHLYTTTDAKCWELEGAQKGAEQELSVPSALTLSDLNQAVLKGDLKPAVYDNAFEGQLKGPCGGSAWRFKKKDRQTPKVVVSISRNSTLTDTTSDSKDLLINLKKCTTRKTKCARGLLKQDGKHHRRKNLTGKVVRKEDGLVWISDDEVVSGSGYGLHKDARIGLEPSVDLHFPPLASTLSHINTVSAVSVTEFHTQREANFTDSDDWEALLTSREDILPTTAVNGDVASGIKTDHQVIDGIEDQLWQQSYDKIVNRGTEHGLLYDRIGSEELLTVTKARTATVTTFSKKASKIKAETLKRSNAFSSLHDSESVTRPMHAKTVQHQKNPLPSRRATTKVRLTSSWESLSQGSGCVLLFGGISQPQLNKEDRIGYFMHYYDTTYETWGGLNKLPEPRFDAAASLLGNGIYLSGGIDYRPMNVEQRSTRNVWYLDLKKWTWQERSSMPRKRCGHALVALGNMLYAIGGAADHMGNGLTAAVDVYSPETDQWTSVASLPLPLWKMAAANHRGRLWVCGGCTKATNSLQDNDNPIETLVSDVYVYKPKHQAWFSAQRLPQRRAMSSLVEVGGQLILIGGIIDSSNQRLATSELTVYCNKTGQWFHLTNMRVPRCSFSAVVTTDEKIVILGGRDGYCGTPLGNIEMYDYETGRWIDILHSLPIPLSNSAAVELATECNQHLLRHISP